MKSDPHRVFTEFTPQAHTVAACFSMLASLNSRDERLRYLAIPVVVFMGFSIEAYLNSVGSRVIEFWDHLERLPWKKKVEILHAAAKKECDWSKGELAFATEIFKLRDKFAHGKGEKVTGREFPTIESAAAYFQGPEDDLVPDWYARLTPEWADAAGEKFHELMIYISALFDFDRSDYMAHSTGGFEPVPAQAK